MFKNAIIFRINDDWEQPSAVAIEEALAQARFMPCGASQRESFGWVEPRGEKNGPLLESVGGQLIFKLMVESKMLPASVVKEEVEKRCDKLKEERGLKRIGSATKREIKEEVEIEFLPKAFTKKGATTMWLNPKDKFIVVDAGSMKKADGIIGRLIDAMSEIGSQLQVRAISTATSPSVAMALWLTEQEPPANFSVDRECELKSTDGEKSTVRYSRHTLDIKEVVEHIKVQGKSPTKLAMTHAGRLSFVLTEDLSLKKIETLDVVLKESEAQDNGFDANVAIITGELCKLVPDLLEALGGEQVPGAHAVEGAGEVGDETSTSSTEPKSSEEATHAPWESSAEEVEA